MRHYKDFPRDLKGSRGWWCRDITEVLSADAELRGYHFVAWLSGRVDPFYLYSPADELIATWEAPPSLTGVADAINAWEGSHEGR